MRPEADFVYKMFNLIDKDKNGFISFREFTDLLIIFANGTEEEKASLLFRMYDINALGYLTPEEFTSMIRYFNFICVPANVLNVKIVIQVVFGYSWRYSEAIRLGEYDLRYVEIGRIATQGT